MGKRLREDETESAISADVAAHCRELIDALSSHDLERLVQLPEIAVIGDTSSGKSSLLSALSGVVFPSDSDICTRCPTRLHLTNADNEELSVTVSIDWRTNATSFERAVSDASAITAAIQEAQKLVLSAAGGSGRVADDVIEVKMRGRGLPDLTLIDLPGIVRTVGRGEDDDICAKIHGIIRPHLENERCIILAVVPANVDFHNSQIMHDAVKHDPSTRRIIPVVTKPDLVDRGAEQAVVDLLLGQKTKTEFALGFHVVKLRSQSDLNDKKPLSASIADEAAFFHRQVLAGDGRRTWASLIGSDSIIGIPNLQLKLSRLYLDHVRAYVPSIIDEIRKLQREKSEQLQQLGETHRTPGERRRAFQRIIATLLSSLKTGVDGEGFTLGARIERLKDQLGVEIASRCRERFGEEECTLETLELLKMEMLRQRDCLPLIFPSMEMFVGIIRNFVEMDMMPAALRFAEQVTQEMHFAAMRSAKESIGVHRHGRLLAFLSEKLSSTLSELTLGSKVEELLCLEAIPYTQNSALSETILKRRMQRLTRDETSSSDEEGTSEESSTADAAPAPSTLLDICALDLHDALYAYAQLVKKRLCDFVPMSLHSRVVTPFFSMTWADDVVDDELDGLFREGSHTAAQRAALERATAALAHADRVVKDFEQHTRRFACE